VFAVVAALGAQATSNRPLAAISKTTAATKRGGTAKAEAVFMARFQCNTRECNTRAPVYCPHGNVDHG
jgi:hypothetical protein